ATVTRTSTSSRPPSTPSFDRAGEDATPIPPIESLPRDRGEVRTCAAPHCNVHHESVSHHAIPTVDPG
ncbi:MAG: hypothetical protein ACREQ5_25090, partial [Candidatus Dormibacteria bacterium]